LKIQVITIGGLKQSYAKEGCALFEKRLKGLARYELKELRDAKRGKTPDIDRWRKEEGEKIRQAIGGAPLWIALDERGDTLTSRQFAQLIQEAQNRAHHVLSFVIGGPDGLDPSLRQSAPKLISLGPMTLPHELARLVLLEQLYRAHAILGNLPYHRD
jgi:23S rRNA (pseudouridine1915-N3)-methyltransferase